MTTDQTYERTFAVGDASQFTLINVRGSITISGWDRAEIAVTAVKRIGNYMGAQQSFDETEVVMDQQGSVVTVRTRMARGFNPFSWLGVGTTAPEVDYSVRVPSRGEMAVRSVGGPIQLRDVAGSTYVRLVNGDIYLERMDGNVIVHGVNGRVSAQEIAGNLAARTVDGSISVRRSRLASLSAKTVSGDVSLQTSLDPRGAYAVKSVSGNLQVYLAAGEGATLALQSTSGHLRCDLPGCQVEDQHHGSQQALVNGGGARVELHSVSGDLSASPASPDGETEASAETMVQPEPAAPPPAAGAPEAPAAPAPPSAPIGEAPELGVLRAVERGELTVDEALKRLEELMGG